MDHEVVDEPIKSLERLDQLKRDFVSNVSHELRTPLTVMMGVDELLRGRWADLSAAPPSNVRRVNPADAAEWTAPVPALVEVTNIRSAHGNQVARESDVH